MSRYLACLRVGVAISLALLLSGCLLFAKTADLRTVHDTYRQEFISAKLPDSQALTKDTPTAETLQPGTFDQTLAAIADYRRKYPTATKELSHLTVLEGMIYLQSRQIGMAKLLTNDVSAAGTELSSASSAPRDSLFATTFRYLVDGWDVIARGDTGQNRQTFEAAANGIKTALCDIKRDGALDKVNGDQGASYIATTGAIFLIWADHAASFECNVRRKPDICKEYYWPATYLDDGRDLIKTFLPQHVQAFVDSGESADQKGQVGGALRFVDYYRVLQKKIEERAQKVPTDQGATAEAFTPSKFKDACMPVEGPG